MGIPWLLFNLYCQNITLLLDSEHTFNQCMGLLGNILPKILHSSSISHNERMQTIMYTFQYLEKLMHGYP